MSKTGNRTRFKKFQPRQRHKYGTPADTLSAKDIPARAVESIEHRNVLASMADTISDHFIPKKPEEEPSLADLFVAATHSEMRGFDGRARKIAAEAFLRYRIDMQRAHRFVLTDDFTAMATELSFATPERTLARLQYATIPYDTTWVEFSLHAKMRAIHARHGNPAKVDMSSISPRLGMLLQRINDTSAVCTLISEIDSYVMPHGSSYFFSTTEMDFDRRVFGCMPLVPSLATVQHMFTTEEENARRITKASLWGYTSKASEQTMIDDSNYDDMIVPSFLYRHGEAGFSRMHPAYQMQVERQGRPEKVAEMIVTELQEFTGTVRWLVTVLAMLNEVPVSTEKVERTSYMRAGRLGKNRLLDYHKVSIRLPKTNPVRFFERKLSHAEITRRRAHEVRTHWRTYLHEERCGREEHAWEYDHEHGYRLCTKCEAYGRLIHEHIRGDVNLGWCRKDYIVKPA